MQAKVMIDNNGVDNNGWARCPKCGHKLFKGFGGWHEVKCHSCKTIIEVGSQIDKLEYLLAKAGMPFRSTRTCENGDDFVCLFILLNNDENAVYRSDMSFDADMEFQKLAEDYGFFDTEEVI